MFLVNIRYFHFTSIHCLSLSPYVRASLPRILPFQQIAFVLPGLKWNEVDNTLIKFSQFVCLSHRSVHPVWITLPASHNTIKSPLTPYIEIKKTYMLTLLHIIRELKIVEKLNKNKLHLPFYSLVVIFF